MQLAPTVMDDSGEGGTLTYLHASGDREDGTIHNSLLCETLFGEWMAMCPVYIY